MTDKDERTEEEQREDEVASAEVPTAFATKGVGWPAGTTTIWR